MTTPRLAHATAWGRMYSRQVGGEPTVPSITTVLSMEPEAPDPHARQPELGVRPQGGALVAWRARLVQDATLAYLRRDEDALTTQFGHVITARDAAQARGANPDKIARAVRGAIAATPDVVADRAAQRGDRVHNLAEAIGNWQIGAHGRDIVDQHLDELAAHGETGFAEALIDWWMRWDIQAVANEVTVWNHDAQTAGTLDIVFTIDGDLFVGDFKTKDDRGGFAKPMQPTVGMQLANALHAHEQVIDPHAGTWEPWPYSQPAGLVAIAVSPSEVVPKQINPGLYEPLWTKFMDLRAMWQDYYEFDERKVLLPMRPPAAAAQWPDEQRVPLPDQWPIPVG